jgi:dihydrofolate reductase
MRKLVVSEWVTLDGVFDADTMPQWFIPFQSDDRARHIKKVIEACDGIVLGRTTYEMLGPYWSAQKNDEQGPAAKLNSVPKYVVSSTMKKADWNNSTIINDNVDKEIAKLKHRVGGDLLVLGSAALVRSLAGSDLVDEYRFLVHPIMMGSGKRFFTEGMATKKLKVLEAETLDMGVVAHRYETTKR